MPQCFVKFPTTAMRGRAQPMLDADPHLFQPFYPAYAATAQKVLIADLSDEQRHAAERQGAKVYEDVQFYTTPPINPLEFRGSGWAYWEPSKPARWRPAARRRAVPPWQSKSLRDVLDHIHAPEAWKKARGKGVTIVIVDTGVAADMHEFPQRKRSKYSKSFAYPDGPWVDAVGHGSMCACIATATSADGGRYDGVAPDATLLSARTNLRATDIYKLYDWILINKRSGNISGPIVISNSYGLYRCSAPPGLPEDHPYAGIVLDAIKEAIPVMFAAGNNHYDELCNNDPTKCSPNTIWAVNSLDDVLSVGTVNWDNNMDVGKHANSSRGPGQWAQVHKKPDCVAPTYGEVMWGSGYQKMEWWGTSGACPQAAGLAALLLSADPRLKPAAIADTIRKACDPLPLAKTCAGAGIINCARAVNSITSVTPRRTKRKRPGRGKSAPRKPR